MARKEPAIVAELGRPETADETAARTAENSRKHRANQTLRNLVGALVASLAVVLFLVVVVVRPDPAPAESIDYAAVATQAQGGSSQALVVPDVPSDWIANAARFDKRSQVLTWYIGFVTPDTQFIALNQGIDANPTWLSDVLDGALATGTTSIGGVEWTVYDRRRTDDPGNVAYALTTESGGSTVVLFGTAAEADFTTFASTVADELEKK